MAIRGDLFERRVFTVSRCETGWQVTDGDAVLTVCTDRDLASAAAARFAREAIGAGAQVRIVEV